MEAQKPNFLIIGSAKCGTTALASILASHPECCFSIPKEVSFFQDNVDYEKNTNYEKGWGWYRRAFSHYASELVIGEATPSYSDRTRSPNTAKRIFEFNPNIKIIYMVRDPIARQVSAWKMQWAEGKSNISEGRPETKWALKGFTYWMRMQRQAGQWDECLYLYQLSAYRELFDEKNIRVMFLEDWVEQRDLEIKRCFNFLGIDPEFKLNLASIDWHSADSRHIERMWLKKMRENKNIRRIVVAFPRFMRTYARERLSKIKAKCPEPNYQSEILQEFRDYLAEDVRKFLLINGKPLNYWKQVDQELEIMD